MRERAGRAPPAAILAADWDRQPDRGQRARWPRLFTGPTVVTSIEGLKRSRAVVLGLSWLGVVVLGLVPLLATFDQRPHAPAASATFALFIAVSSALLLRHHYSWGGAALHVAGQVMIGLSISVLTLAALAL